MKKAVLAVTALFAAVTAAPAMAEEFSYGGFMRYRGINIDPGTVPIFGAAPDESSNAFEYRIRQFFNLKVNDHVTTNVKFEWNSQFGDEQQIAGGSGDLQFGGPPATTNNEVQFRIKNAFLRFDVPGAPVSITVGQQDFSTPKALISVEDGTGVKLNAKVDPVDLTLFWQKNKNGGDNAAASDDAHWFGAVPSFKAGDITIAPHVSYFKAGSNVQPPPAAVALLQAAEIWYLGLDTSGKLGPVGFTFDFVYQTGETGTGSLASPNRDIASFILDASASLTAGPGTLTGKVLYSPGDDNIGAGNDIDSWVNVIATDMGWSPFFHDGSSNSNFAGTVTPGIDGVGSSGAAAGGGILALGLEYSLAPFKDLTVTPNVYYLMADEDINANGQATRTDDFYGIEAGLQANWRLWDSVVLLAQVDYLFAGDVFEDANGDTKDAWRFIVGPSISW